MVKAYGLQENTVRTGADGIVMDIGEGSKAAHGFKGVIENKGIKGGKKDLLDDVSSFDAKNAHNYMAVMSNTMSNKDFQAMKEEGYHPGRMSEAEAVTGLDRIKVVLAESGVNVAGFTDTVDKDKVAEITGSVSAAAAVMKDTPVDSAILENREALENFVREGLENADLPCTDNNVKEALTAFETAAKTETPDKGSVDFLLSNAMEPTIENVYMAEHSGSGEERGAAGYFDNDGTGYYAEIAESDDLDALKGQIDRIIEESGFAVNETLEEDAENLIKAGYALNKENLRLYEDLKSIELPLKAGELMIEIADSITRGGNAGSAYLIKDYNRIKNERILNETRLRMNTEANRTMTADNGFTLDTEELSGKVDELKARERAFYRALFMKDGENSTLVEEKISLAEETLYKVSQIKNMPAQVIGRFSSAEAFTINDVYEAGNDLKVKFEAANATYEAVGTEVRRDLGDRIDNAFRNAGELLHELGIKETIDNLRAVRILGYNSMEINGENIAEVRAADQTVRTLINRLSGAAAVSLIRNGVNPLETGVNELIEKIAEFQGIDEENEKFSEYLFKLERSNSISEDEAESYIGVFRLIRQIENSDGAVIGALVNSGKELSLKNLLTELRTRGKGHIDFSIDEEFGGVTKAESDSNNLRIDTQIETAFRNESGENGSNADTGSNSDNNAEEQYAKNAVHELYDGMSPDTLPSAGEIKGDTTVEELLDYMREAAEKAGENEELYAAELAEEIRDAASKEEKVYEMLLHYGQEISPENVNAADALINSRGAMFAGLAEILAGNIKDRIKSRSEDILDRMGETEPVGEDEAVEGEDPADSVKEAYGEMTEELQSAVNTAMEEADRYIDLKSLKNLNRQLTVAKALSKEENFEIPMEIGGRLTSVNLKVVRGTGETKAAVSYETAETGKVYAEFRLGNGKVSGYVTSSEDTGVSYLESRSEAFFAGLSRAGIERDEIFFEKSLSGDINRIPETADISSIRDKNNTLSGTDGVNNTGLESMDAESNTAYIYRAVKVFLQTVR